MVSSEPQVTHPIITEPVHTGPTYTVPYESAPSVRTPDIRVTSPPQQTSDPRFIQVLPRLPDPGSGRIYRLQVGAFSNEINARDAVFRLRELGFDPAYELYGGYCRVIITGVRSGDVTAVIQRLGAAGFEQIFIREDP